jgi:hypothetical protein
MLVFDFLSQQYVFNFYAHAELTKKGIFQCQVLFFVTVTDY